MIGNNSNRLAVNGDESGNDIGGPTLAQFKHFAVVRNGLNYFANVVTSSCRVWNDSTRLGHQTVGCIAGVNRWCKLINVVRDVSQKVFERRNSRLVVGNHHACDAALLGMRIGSA